MSTKKREKARSAPISKKKKLAKNSAVSAIARDLTPFLKKTFIPNFPYILMFWFGDLLGKAYRLAPNTDLLKKLIYSMETLGSAMAKPFPSFVPSDLLAGAAFAGIIYGVIWYRKKHSKKWRKDVEYGSARWGWTRKT